MKNILILIFILTSFGIHSQEADSTKNIMTVGCQVVEKAFINKGGKASDFKELYLRCSVQDYYIKFCESKVSLKKIKKHRNKGISVTIEIKDGEWDICEGDPEMQSRVGPYVAILSIEK